MEIANLYARVSANVSDYDKKMAGVRSDLSATQAAFSRMGSMAGTALKAVGVGAVAAGGAIAGIAASGTRAAVDFESAFTGVIKTVDATDEELAMLRESIIDMTQEIPLAATEIAGIAEAAGQLGIKTENILGFTRVMADLGVTTNMSSDEAATALARFANITGMSQTEFDRLGSSIVALGNNLATTEGEIVEMGLRIAGAGAQVGMTEAQIMGMAGALSSVGINAEAGGTAISRVMIDMASAVAEGGNKLNMIAEVAGMTGDRFTDVFKNNASFALQAFIKGLDHVSQSGGDLFGTLERLNMDEIRVRDTLLRLAGASQVFHDALQISNNAWEENTALTKEAELRYGTTASKFQLFRNAIDAVRIEIGDKLLPLLGDFLDWGTEFVKKVGPHVVNFFGRLAERISRFVENARNWLARMTNTFSFNFAIIGSENASIGEKLLAIWDMLAQEGMRLFRSLINSIIESLPKWLAALGDWARALWEWIKESTPKALAALWEWAKGLWGWLVENVPTWAANLWEWAKALWQWIVEVTPIALEKLGEWGSALITYLGENLPGWIATFFEWGAALWTWIGEALPNAINALAKFLAYLRGEGDGATEGFWAMVGRWARALWEWITTVALPQIAPAFAKYLQAVLTAGKNIWDALKNLAVELGKTLWFFIVEVIPDVLRALGQWGATIWQWLVQNGPSWFKTLDEWGRGAWQWIQEALGPVARWLGKLAAEFISWSDIVIGSVIALGIIFWPTISAAFTAVLGAIGGFVSAWAPILGIFAAAIAAVVLVRNAWVRDWGGIRTFTLETLEFLSKAFAPLQETIKQFGMEALKEIILWATGNQTNFDAVRKIWEAARTAFSTVFTAIGQKLVEWGKIAWDWFRDKFPNAAGAMMKAVDSIRVNFNELWDALRPLIQKFKDEFQRYRENWQKNSGLIGNALSDLQRVLDNVWAIMVTGARLSINNLLNLLTLIVQMINGDWKGAWNTAKQIVRDTWSAVVDIVRHAVEAVLALFGTNLEGMRRWFDRTVEMMRSWADKFRAWGRNIIQGLRDGITEKWNDLTNWFSGVWRDLTDRFKRFFGIHSPSTLFRTYGDDMMQGLRNGIDAGAGQVFESVDNIKDGIAGRLSAINGLVDKTKLALSQEAWDAQLKLLEELSKPIIPDWAKPGYTPPASTLPPVLADPNAGTGGTMIVIPKTPTYNAVHGGDPRLDKKMRDIANEGALDLLRSYVAKAGDFIKSMGQLQGSSEVHFALERILGQALGGAKLGMISGDVQRIIAEVERRDAYDNTADPQMERNNQLLEILINELRNKNMNVEISALPRDDYGNLVAFTAAGAH